MAALPQISEAEYEVMKVVWKYAPINTNPDQTSGDERRPLL